MMTWWMVGGGAVATYLALDVAGRMLTRDPEDPYCAEPGGYAGQRLKPLEPPR